MKVTLAALAAVMLFGLQGCASVTKGTKDTIQVQVSNCSNPMDCTATNKKGTWTFTAPGPVTFKKSDQDLIIACNDGGSILTRSLRPTRGGMIWGNVLIGGIIGGGVDAMTDAHWDMADSLILHRDNCPNSNLRISNQQMQPSNRQVPPANQQVQPSSQKVQGNQAEDKPNYVVAPRPSRLEEVDARDKDACKLIQSITRKAGGSRGTSSYVKTVKNSAITEAANIGADSYFMVNTQSTTYGASVTLEALKCR